MVCQLILHLYYKNNIFSKALWHSGFMAFWFTRAISLIEFTRISCYQLLLGISFLTYWGLSVSTYFGRSASGNCIASMACSSVQPILPIRFWIVLIVLSIRPPTRPYSKPCFIPRSSKPWLRLYISYSLLSNVSVIGISKSCSNIRFFSVMLFSPENNIPSIFSTPS